MPPTSSPASTSASRLTPRSPPRCRAATSARRRRPSYSAWRTGRSSAGTATSPSTSPGRSPATTSATSPPASASASAPSAAPTSAPTPTTSRPRAAPSHRASSLLVGSPSRSRPPRRRCLRCRSCRRRAGQSRTSCSSRTTNPATSRSLLLGSRSWSGSRTSACSMTIRRARGATRRRRSLSSSPRRSQRATRVSTRRAARARARRHAWSCLMTTRTTSSFLISDEIYIAYFVCDVSCTYAKDSAIFLYKSLTVDICKL